MMKHTLRGSARALIAACFLGLMLAAAPVPAFAVGEPEPAQQPSCPSGQVYNPTCKACAKRCASGTVWDCGRRACVQRQSDASDDEIYAQAVALVKEQRYDEARTLLLTIQNQSQAKVLNYIGFTTRKLGDVDKGITYYQQALAIDPDYVKAREYLGEGYLQKNDVDHAKEQLNEIAKRCGKTCEEYTLLADAIAMHLSGEKFIKTW